MLSALKIQLQSHLEQSLKDSLPPQVALPPLELDTPAEKIHGEFSCNIALKSTKILKKPPLDIAREFCAIFQKAVQTTPLKGKIDKIEVKKPGFINFFLSRHALCDVLVQIFQEKERYGKSDFGRRKKIQIEFVSANPTGPLSVAHARQAAVGDALAHILDFLGFDVTREYYVNDEGNQINFLGASVGLRAQEILTKRSVVEDQFTDNHYRGEYIKDIAQRFLADKKIKDAEALEDKAKLAEMAQYAVDYLMGVIKKELADFGVHFDVWSYQSRIATKDHIEDVLAYLGGKGFLYEKDGALWFKSTDFEDDKDRVVEKSDGTYTYLTPDIVYHKNKFERGFAKVINIWGPDHHGYIPRLKAAVEALGKERKALEVLIVQLATIFRDGQPVSMSTRRGQYISLREVMDEVGVDAARFFFLMRHINAHLDFDLELAKKETPENPVYYIQYAHARIHSINKKAGQEHIKMKTSGFCLLKEKEELDLLKKLGNFPDVVMVCYNELDPYALVNYLQELATVFHRFYDCHRVLGEDKALSAERLALVNATRMVLANGLRLLGVSTPERM